MFFFFFFFYLLFLYFERCRVAIFIEKIMQTINGVTGVCSRELINVFLVGQVSGLVENFNTGIYSHTKNVINVKFA